VPQENPGKRVYINILNKCNERCPFCCMYSGPEKNTIMPFSTFEDILQNERTGPLVEVQLEGGEPLLHPNLYLFLEYIHYLDVPKIIITTNGILLRKHLPKLTEFASRTQTTLVIKVSVNSHLLKQPTKLGMDHFEQLKDLYLATEFLPNVIILFNVRLRANHEDDDIVEGLRRTDLLKHSNVFQLQSYGRYSEQTEYEKPVIVQNIKQWNIYSSDGICFGQDLVARSNHEKDVR